MVLLSRLAGSYYTTRCRWWTSEAFCGTSFYTSRAKPFTGIVWATNTNYNGLRLHDFISVEH